MDIFLVKKAEIVSLKPEHQNEIHFLKCGSSVDNIGWHVELDQRYVKSLLDAMAMNQQQQQRLHQKAGNSSRRLQKKGNLTLLENKLTKARTALSSAVLALRSTDRCPLLAARTKI